MRSYPRYPIDAAGLVAAGLVAVCRRRHAVVVGGSLAGMLAARVLSDHFDDVTLLSATTSLRPRPPAKDCRRAGTRTHCWTAAAKSWSGSSRASQRSWCGPALSRWTGPRMSR